MSRILRSMALLVVLSAVPALSACGSDSRTKVETTTTGQQLIDLQKAYDDGAISRDEYEHKRADILREHD
jgi:hypothetical protein